MMTLLVSRLQAVCGAIWRLSALARAVGFGRRQGSRRASVAKWKKARPSALQGRALYNLLNVRRRLKSAS